MATSRSRVAGSTSDIDDGWGELLGEAPDGAAPAAPAPVVVPPVPGVAAPAVPPVPGVAAPVVPPVPGVGTLEPVIPTLSPPSITAKSIDETPSSTAPDPAVPEGDDATRATDADDAEAGSSAAPDSAVPEADDVETSATSDEPETGHVPGAASDLKSEFGAEESSSPATETESAATRDSAVEETLDAIEAEEAAEESVEPRRVAAKPPTPFFSTRPSRRAAHEEEESAFDTSAAIAKLIEAQESGTAKAKVDVDAPSNQAHEEEGTSSATENTDSETAEREGGEDSDKKRPVFVFEPSGDLLVDTDKDTPRPSPAAPPPAATQNVSRPIMWAGGLAAIAAVAILSWATNRDPAVEVHEKAPVVAQRAAGKPAPKPAAQEPAAQEPENGDRVPAKASAITEVEEPGEDELPVQAAANGTNEALAPEPEEQKPAPEAAPVAPEPPKTEEPPPSPAPAPTAVPSGEPEAAYADALEAYEADGSTEALEQMALAACEMLDGAKARSAYRKLRGKEPRGRVMNACKAQKIDLNYRGDGASPDELLRIAQRALDRGDLQKALDNARASNKAQRSKDALIVMAQAACDLKDEKQARYFAGMLNPKDRAPIEERCKTNGLDLSAP